MNAMIGVFVQILLGATALWGESSLVAVYPDTAPPSVPAAGILLSAARGEQESFQLCIRPGGEGLTAVEIGGDSPGPGIGPPRIHRVGYLRVTDTAGVVRRVPDPLLAPDAADLPGGETAAYWITYAVHRDCAPGSYTGRIVMRSGAGTAQTFPVTIEVFDFTIPEMPTPTAAFRLDVDRIARLYGLRFDEVLSWKAFYDAVSDYRIAYGIGAEAMVNGPPGLEASAFKDHLAYVIPRGHLAAVDLTPGPEGVGRFPTPDAPNAQDALQTYLLDMTRWLADHGWEDRAYLRPASVPSDGSWQDVRALYFRARRADKRVALLMDGAIHPYFERYVDIWAPSLELYQPNAHVTLKAGRSLAVRQGVEAAAIEASSIGEQPGGNPTRAEDAYDGSVFSEWWSGGGAVRETLRIGLVEPVATPMVRIGWVPGREASDVVVRTSFDGRVFSRAKVNWRHTLAAHEYDRSVSEGTFVTDKRLLAIEFTFDLPRGGGPVAVAEIELAPPLGEAVDRPNPARTWIQSQEQGFPDLSAGGTPIGPRLFGWIIWGHRADGLLGGTLNAWPQSWDKNSQAGGFASGTPYGGWIYPGPHGLLPSIRLHLLRDGLEDYEYCRLAEQLMSEGERPPDIVETAISLRYFTASPAPDVVGHYLENIPAWRVAIGRFVADPSAPVTNFQGGRR